MLSKEQQKANRRKFAKRLRWAERTGIKQGHDGYHDGCGRYCAIGVELYFGKGEFLTMDSIETIHDQVWRVFGVDSEWLIYQNDIRRLPFRVIAEEIDSYKEIADV